MQRLDPFHRAGDEPDQQFAFELGLGGELPPVNLVEVYGSVVVLAVAA